MLHFSGSVYFFRALRSRDRKGKNETPFLVGYFRWHFWFLGSALKKNAAQFLIPEAKALSSAPRSRIPHNAGHFARSSFGFQQLLHATLSS